MKSTATIPILSLVIIFLSMLQLILGVTTHWIEMGMKEDSQTMALIAMRLLFIKPGEPIRL